jgi:hypothetical protein
VGKDGKPAEFAPDNVPYQPESFLKIDTEGFKPGDLAFVVGYPGSTERLTTALETHHDIEWNMPRRVDLYQKYIDCLNDTAGDTEELKIKAASMISGLENYKKNFIGCLAGADQQGLMEIKWEEEKNLQAWIETQPERKNQYGTVIADIDALLKTYYQSKETDLVNSLLGSRYNPLLQAAIQIVRMAEERPKADLDRDPEYQERNWQRLEQQQVQLQKSYSRELNIALLTLTLQEGLALPADQQPALLHHLFPQPPTPQAIEETVISFFEKTRLEDVDFRVQLLKNASVEKLEKSDDPILQLALKLNPELKALKEKRERLSGALVLLRPAYFAAYNEFKQGQIAPDANSTIRVSFGTVRGFKPTPEQDEYTPFTKVWEVAEKWAIHQGEEPFDAPAKLIDAIQARRFGPYIMDEIGQVPVNLLTDLDITGGNSGSPTLNRRAEFAGIAFDGNIEGVASDLLFLPEVTRAIHVDARYILWVLDAVEHADALLKEMGITPSFSQP